MKQYEIQANYSYGWEEVFTASTMTEARGILSDYRKNEPTTAFRIVSVRVSAKGWELGREVTA
jgi:hypothetical protein